MKKDTFKTSIFILLIGGFFTKVLSFFIRVFYTRIVGSEGINLYTIVTPTFSLFITLASFALPISISKLVSENTMRSKKIVFSTFLFILAFNAFLILAVIGCAPFIAGVLLKQPSVTPLLYAMAFTLPFISITSILKGYFLGKLNVAPNTISNIFEQFARILFIFLGLPLLVKKSVLLGVIGYILFNIVTEIISIFTFYLFLPKKISLEKKDFTLDRHVISRVLKISIPSVSSRLIGNISFFLEPILLTHFLLLTGYSSSYILEEYASYNAYAIGLLTMPSFFIAAICQILIPEISKYHSQKNDDMVKRRLKQALFYSFIIGFAFSFFFFFFRDSLLNLIYKTTRGSEYIFALAPFFVLFYLEAPLSSALQALDQSKKTMQITFYGSILKLGSMVFLAFFKIGLYALVLSEILNIFFVVFLNTRALKKCLSPLKENFVIG